jgi:hypothetical protein
MRRHIIIPLIAVGEVADRGIICRWNQPAKVVR